ncbi:glycoside hydrolase family 3 protein [Novosphingobium kaempferiae]|uniref:glycoside hydrolase family 3 protein n=1 Tax=Novosphingobium kaempferiae TaxID=2896849 RepID=UPI001E5E5C63|nr:glycoside hydrolase family 3 N-terminal domain-containing protein [Novosphingobium kaempferiae]
MKSTSLLLATLAAATFLSTPVAAQPEIGAREKPAIAVDGKRFHDLDGDGRLSPYEDWRLPPERRTQDLLARMTLEEKAGMLVQGTPPNIGGGLMGDWDIAALRPTIETRHIRYFIHRSSGDGAKLAEASNAVQALAERTRLGIPVVLSSDPRNTYRASFGINVPAGQFTRWPESLGLGALGDADVVRRLSAIASQEMRAIGIRMTLSPQADLFTDPRWGRGNATFGDDAALVSRLAGAAVEGLQGGRDGVGPQSVAAVVKHWVGYGAQPEGLDSHNPYGQTMTFPGGGFPAFVRAFDGAFAAHAAGVMPTYSRPVGLVLDGRPVPSVGAGFSRELIDGLLRRQARFTGVVVSDFKITDDCESECQAGTMKVPLLGMPWGVEHLSKAERYAMAFDAGVDQVGGAEDVDLIAENVRKGRTSQAQLDLAAGRMLELAFRLGLFENAYVDPAKAQATLGAAQSVALAQDVQRRSMVLLRNEGGVLPLAKPRKVWLWNVSEEAARAHGLEPVADPAQAEVSILRIAAPYTSHAAYFFGQGQHEGPLSFPPGNADLAAVERAAAAGKPVIVSAYLDRPAILGPIVAHASGLLADFGSSDNAVLDVVLGRARPEGHLPVELPSSDEAATRQSPDLPSDSANPLFPRGFGLSYTR